MGDFYEMFYEGERFGLAWLDLAGFGVDELPLAIRTAGALVQYVRDTQKSALPHIRALGDPQPA